MCKNDKIKTPYLAIEMAGIDFELTEENIDNAYEQLDDEGLFGAIVVWAYDEDEDFRSWVGSGCDIADGLYDALDAVQEFIDDDYTDIVVAYTRKIKLGNTDIKITSEEGFRLLGAALEAVSGADPSYSVDCEPILVYYNFKGDEHLFTYNGGCDYYNGEDETEIKKNMQEILRAE